ncbi:hypothetical protein BM221_003809 [Beauveria bassiana]|uniref:Uncharacterized protein n=1 Tax=Beauveria bassiana TaxID=176275 RepID=A0A2N6NVQ1_BEABA|nr:hypothetical protein BM221_003809 [Beauveria bassiana]
MLPSASPTASTEGDDDLYLSDDIPEIDNTFDADRGQLDAETDKSEPEDVGLDGDTDCDDINVEDQLLLFDGNTHPLEYYLKGIKDFNAADYEAQIYSDGSKVLIDAIEEQWCLFCDKVLSKIPQAFFESSKASLESFNASPSYALSILHTFFKWKLSQKLGKDGRKLKGIKKKSSLETYWKIFRLYFSREVGEKINLVISRNMHKVLRRLAIEFDLSSTKRMNRRMTIKDLEEQIEETLSTPRKSFKLGELRILAVLFLLLIAPAGSRPQSVLRMRFKDIDLVLAKDPEGGPINILLRFTLEFTKTYLGLKDP